MSLFTTQLKALRATMRKTVPENFDMDQWNCGTVGCICGHQALSNDLKAFPTAFPLSVLTNKSTADVSHISSSIADDLNSSCKELLGTDFLARSVWQSYARKILASGSAVLSEDQLEHPHLTTCSSPGYAVSYITMLLGVIK